MADWSKPILRTGYPEVLTTLDGKDFDSASLFLNEPASHRDGMIKLLRSPVKFQERDGGSWDDLVLSIKGGGTGATSAEDARDNLLLGSMASQDSDDVSISGGTLAGGGAGITGLKAGALSSGTIPDARFPSTLPKASGRLLTNLNGSSVTEGTIPGDRLGTGRTDEGVLHGNGTWDTISANIQANQIIGGIIDGARLPALPRIIKFYTQNNSKLLTRNSSTYLTLVIPNCVIGDQLILTVINTVTNRGGSKVTIKYNINNLNSTTIYESSNNNPTTNFRSIIFTILSAGNNTIKFEAKKREGSSNDSVNTNLDVIHFRP